MEKLRKNIRRNSNLMFATAILLYSVIPNAHAVLGDPHPRKDDELRCQRDYDKAESDAIQAWNECNQAISDRENSDGNPFIAGVEGEDDGNSCHIEFDTWMDIAQECYDLCMRRANARYEELDKVLKEVNDEMEERFYK